MSIRDADVDAHVAFAAPGTWNSTSDTLPAPRRQSLCCARSVRNPLVHARHNCPGPISADRLLNCPGASLEASKRARVDIGGACLW